MDEPPTHSSPTPSSPTEADAIRREVMGWHAGWAAAVILGGVALAFAVRGVEPVAWLALVLGAAPPIAAFTLKQGDTDGRRLALLVQWAMMSVLACGLTGGVGGPLAVWCVAPLAAAAVFVL